MQNWMLFVRLNFCNDNILKFNNGNRVTLCIKIRLGSKNPRPSRMTFRLNVASVPFLQESENNQGQMLRKHRGKYKLKCMKTIIIKQAFVYSFITK